MYLLTDEQTIDDLRIFSKRDSAGIFDLYNNTHTRGGQVELENAFRTPLCDLQEINRRSGIIGHFAKLELVFPFDVALFDMAEKYLANQQGAGQHTRQTLSEKDIQHGVMAVIGLFRQVRSFTMEPSVSGSGAYSQDRRAIESLVNDPAFEPVFAEAHTAKLSYAAITAFDVLLRVRERKKVLELMSHIYTLDMYISVAQVALKRKLCFPEALDSENGEMVIQGLYHPELKNPVANDISINRNRNLIFLTGANMAGKSTF
ncbi:MAG: DNA mismatch repair protein, partial [Sphingobacteriales bacterium]